MVNDFKRLLEELWLVSKILPISLFWRWILGIPQCFKTLLETKSLGALDRVFGDSFKIVWNQQILSFDGLDFGVFREIYGHLCYCNKGELKDAKHILDLGANGGAFTIFALEEAPYARVHAVEAQSEFIDIIEHNAKQNRHGDRVSLECALVGGFYNEWTNLLRQKNPTLKIFNILDYLSRVGTCDFLKCDVEGGEFYLFQGDLSWTQSVKRIALEFHPDYGDVDELEKKLKQQGFKIKKVDRSCLGYFYCSRD